MQESQRSGSVEQNCASCRVHVSTYALYVIQEQATAANSGCIRNAVGFSRNQILIKGVHGAGELPAF